MRITKIELADGQAKALDFGFRNGKSHAFCMRCRAILLTYLDFFSIYMDKFTD